MNAVSLAWMLGKPTKGRRAPILLTAGAYALVSALVMITAAGALSFGTMENDYAAMYQLLAALAVVLLLVPLLVLGSAAARLSARSQDQRLSTVRLLGGTPGLVLRVTLIESVAVALAGSLAGILLYAAAAPAVGLIRFQGEPLGAAMWLDPLVVLACTASVLLLAAVSSAFGLRKVIVSPLGVRNRVVTPKPRWIRAVIVAALILAVYLGFSMLSAFKDIAVVIAVLLSGFAVSLGALNLVGPWVVARMATAKLKRAQGPAKLLAARMVLESPAQAWRQVSGVAMIGFVAVVGGSGAALMAAVGGESDLKGPDALFATDVMTGVLLTIAVGFVSVACSTAITQAAATLDRAELYANLDRLGVPLRVMEQARVGSVMGPLLGVAVGSVLVSGTLMLPLAGMAMLLAPESVAIVLGTLLAGVLAVRGAVALTGIGGMLGPRAAVSG